MRYTHLTDIREPSALHLRWSPAASDPNGIAPKSLVQHSAIRQGLKALLLVSMLCLIFMVTSAGLPQGSLAERLGVDQSNPISTGSAFSVNLILSSHDASVSYVHQSFISSPRVFNVFTSRVSLRGQQAGVLLLRFQQHDDGKASRGVAHIDAPEFLHVQTSNFPLLN